MSRRNKNQSNAKPQDIVATPAPIGDKPDTVPMVRDGKLADVHPAEVDNYARYGWVKCP
jgi:hypothetical protein